MKSLLSGLLVFLLTGKQTALPALVLFILLSCSGLTSGQPGPTGPRDDPYGYGGSLTPAMAVVVVVVIAALFLMAFITVYIRHCSESNGGSVRARAGGARRVTNATAARGLDALTIENFPTFVYSEVKTQKIGKGALECAICLNEFEDDETLRLLPKCDHVFHPHCIGAWLQGHVTCPVCRTNLAEKQEPIEPVVEITEPDLESAIPEPAVEVARVTLPRSHTTGHTVVLPGECTERFTLKIPDDLRKKIMANWKMNRSNSVLVLPRGGSSRSGKQVDRSRAKSDRWLFRKTPSFLRRNGEDGSIRLGGTGPTGSIRANAITSPTGDSVRADRWAFLRNPSFLWRTSPVPSPRVGVDGEGSSSVHNTGSVRLPV